jgi:hypothetical protein
MVRLQVVAEAVVGHARLWHRQKVDVEAARNGNSIDVKLGDSAHVPEA